MKLFKLFFLIAIFGSSDISQAASVDDLISNLNNRSGSSSEDRRHDVKGPLGLKIGCRGDVLEAKVRITSVSGKIDNDIAKMSVTYNGSYYRQGWDIPCQKVSPALNGLEKVNIYGTYSFELKGGSFQKPIITWGVHSNFGEKNYPKHDSNIMAIEAVKNAIGSAF